MNTLSKCVCGSPRPQRENFKSIDDYLITIRAWKAEHFTHLYGRDATDKKFSEFLKNNRTKL